jgi:hypothetical protein
MYGYFIVDKIFRFLLFLMKVWKGLYYFSESTGNFQLKFDFCVRYFVHLSKKLNMIFVPGKIVFLLGNVKCNKYSNNFISIL